VAVLAASETALVDAGCPLVAARGLGGPTALAEARREIARVAAMDARVVCLDDSMRRMLEHAYAPGGHPRLVVIPNWEPAARFPAGGRPPTWEGTDRLGLRGKLVVLYLGNAGAGHRFDTVIQAAQRLPAMEHALLFVGGGSAWPDLRAARDSGRPANWFEGVHDVAFGVSERGVSLITGDEMLGVMSPSKLHSVAAGLPILYIGLPGGNVHEAIERSGCGISLRHGDVDGAGFLSRQPRPACDRPAPFPPGTRWSPDQIGLAVSTSSTANRPRLQGTWRNPSLCMTQSGARGMARSRECPASFCAGQVDALRALEATSAAVRRSRWV
jgi:hypothetical protein